MSRPRTHEARLLAEPAELLARAMTETGTAASATVDVLEALVAIEKCWSLEDFRAAFPRTRELSSVDAALWAEKVSGVLPPDEIMPRALVLAALAQPALGSGERRRSGAYYTDYRLARFLARQFDAKALDGNAIDLAAGSGMLLAALTLQASAGDTGRATDFVARCVCAADLHPEALAATRVALAALVDDVAAIVALDSRMLLGDSLLRTADEWESLAPGGFAAVVMNPPWERLKVTRHEVSLDAGATRHYGALYDDSSHIPYERERQKMAAYIQDLAKSAVMQGKGEFDLYKLFLELGVRVLRPGGQLGLLVPAGLIRSQGSTRLREFLFQHTRKPTVTVLDNRASFFPIDSRFKFLAVHATVAQAESVPITLLHGRGTPTGVEVTGCVELGLETIRGVRPDLTIPEVRNRKEWQLFEKLSSRGSSIDESRWAHSFQRELDMTADRGLFRAARDKGDLPLVEGRMVHQHRVRAKRYVSGTGRAARWEPLALGHAAFEPQFWVAKADLRPGVRTRTDRLRAGFCDITGQTNERTVLAAVIPPGVVCGNKVPTLTFEGTEFDPDLTTHAWVALANSFVVDWAARRVVTTTLNYFLLRSLPIPPLSARQVVELAQAGSWLRSAELNGAPGWAVASVRALVDATVAEAFDLSLEQLALVLADFPLIDRGQPAIPGEARSTVTEDYVMATYAKRRGMTHRDIHERVTAARAAGAVPYVPADYQRLVTGERPNDRGGR